MVSDSEMAKLFSWTCCDSFRVVWEQVRGHYLLPWSYGLALRFFGSPVPKPQGAWRNSKDSWAFRRHSERPRGHSSQETAELHWEPQLCPLLSGSVNFLSMSLSSSSYYKETWSPNMGCPKLCVFWQDTSSLGLMFPMYKTKDLD